MALVANIQPIQIIDKTATQLSTYIVNYDLQGKNCSTYWWLTDSTGRCLYEGNYKIPEDVLATWTTNDDIIIEAVATGKGFTIINIVSGSTHI